MLKKMIFVRIFLLLGLFTSILFAGYGIFYKINYLDFSFTPQKKTPVWSVEAHLTFQPTAKESKITFARPQKEAHFKILDESIIANGFQTSASDSTFTVTGKAKKKQQDIYYRLLIYDVKKQTSINEDNTPPVIAQSLLDDETKRIAKEILSLVDAEGEDRVKRLIQFINQEESNELVYSYFPLQISLKEKAEKIIELLALENIPARLVRGIMLEEGKKSFLPDVMIEVYDNNKKGWNIYDIQTAEEGTPLNFIAFQKGNTSLFDVTGGKDSSIKYSVLKSLNSSFSMAKYRAKNAEKEPFFNYSIYNLPVDQQNALKWLMVFPLAILLVVILRNVIGIKTMGTFTPMLISMALVETGLLSGLSCFSLIVAIGLAIRYLLSKLNLLLVPRISAVVIFVILIIQYFSIIGYQLDWKIGTSSLFFPIIILAWIIERASIIWEEEGLHHAVKEVFNSVLAAILIYFIIENETIRHIMFVFNELNFVILFITMLLGTYTGYRLTELKRFAPLVKKNKKPSKRKV
ncbi:MAG: UUP1 family membrane protein [Alphaproteobacteria bacterium]|nr:UUP1 family membrane protein [Alphaproteobacteria bacterium]